jgi:hypothetical protein
MYSLCVDVSLLEAGVMRNSGKGEERDKSPTLSSAVFVEISWEIMKLLGHSLLVSFSRGYRRHSLQYSTGLLTVFELHPRADDYLELTCELLLFFLVV